MNTSSTNITPAEEKILKAIRSIMWGRVIVLVKAGQPVRVVQVEKEIKLD